MSTPRYIGKKRSLALFSSRGTVVIVDTAALTASVATPESLSKAYSGKNWDTSSNPDPLWVELADATLRREFSPKAVPLAVASKRNYTVPKLVSVSAQTSLEKFSSDLGPVATHVAALLASGDQISCEDALWCSRFFLENPKESVSRGSWLAWGGDAGQAWTTGLSTRINYDSVVADAGSYETPGIQAFLADPNAEEARTFFCELDAPMGQFTNNLYMLSQDGTWSAWGNGDWIASKAPEFSTRTVELDSESALFVAGALFDAPEAKVDLRAANPEAWDLAVEAFSDLDLDFIDRVSTYSMTADATAPAADYTPEERSQDASSQLRDANGRFASVGDSGAIKSNGLGASIIEADSSTGQLKVETEDGQVFDIPVKDFEVGATPHPKVDPKAVKEEDALNLEGIVAPVPDPIVSKASLRVDPTLLSPVAINESLEEYTEEITSSRQAKSVEFKKLVDEVSDTIEDLLEGEDSDDDDDEVEVVVAAGETEEDLPSSTGEDIPPASADPTPDESDVAPVYMAIVDPDDPRAVMDLVALVPATATSSEPKTFKRSGGKWVEDSSILADLRSATPPAIVQLDSEQYEDVLFQIDSAGEEPPAESGEGEQSVTAAGGADRNRGGAGKLRVYWTVGPGGMKIRWGTGGDWTRCVRLLSKHLGPRAKGYCALRHKEMTGTWPGDRKNREASVQGMVAAGMPKSSLGHLKTSQSVVRASADFAKAEVAKSRVYGNYEYQPVIPSPEDIDSGRSGRAFKIPLVIPEGIPTGDGREFTKGSLGMRTFPLPLLWQPATNDGHDTSYIVGRIDRMERTSSGLGNAYGVFDTGPYGKEAQRLVENFMLRWVSADLDKFEVDEENSDPQNGKMRIKKGRVMGVTLVAKPAFQECVIELISEKDGTDMIKSVPSTITASASIAQAIPVEPPSSWFEDPQLSGPSPIQVDDNGRLFGHIATWDTNHIGMAGDVAPPRSASGYAYFHTGVVRTHEGHDVKVGQLTLSGGHAPIHLDASSAVRHYDDTLSAFADVHAGEDQYGIWVSGALRPGTTPEQIRALRASAPSGDWRAINRRLELVAVCQVNVPGFPVPRALAASAGSQEKFALVAAGTSTLWAMRHQEFSESDAEAARQRLSSAFNLDEYATQHESLTASAVEELYKSGSSMSDGSFQIDSSLDLRKALRVYGTVASSKQAAVRRHIIRRARTLGKADLVPSSWRELALPDSTLASRDRYEAMVASARADKVAQLSARVKSPENLASKVAELRARIGKN